MEAITSKTKNQLEKYVLIYVYEQIEQNAQTFRIRIANIIKNGKS